MGKFFRHELSSVIDVKFVLLVLSKICQSSVLEANSETTCRLSVGSDTQIYFKFFFEMFGNV